MLLVSFVTIPARAHTHWGSPFVQRVWIALELKGIDYQYIEVQSPTASLIPPHLLTVSIVEGRSVCKAENTDRHQSSRPGASAEARRVGASLLPTPYLADADAGDGDGDDKLGVL